MVKVGDKVRSLVTEFDVREGCIYEVESVGADGAWVIDDVYDEYYLSSDEYESVAVAGSNDNRFKVGDRVRVAKSPNNGGFGEIGDTGTVSCMDRESVRMSFDTGSCAGSSWWIAQAAIELVDAPLTIRSGAFYRTRDGRKVGPAEVSDDYEYPWRASGALYLDNGRWLNDDIEDDNDIIAEWTDEPVAAVTSSNDYAYGISHATTGFTVPLDAPEFGGGEAGRFKVGDRVEIANNESDRISYVGKTGEVVHVSHEVTVKLDGSDSELFFRESELRLVAEATTAQEPSALMEFKDGKFFLRASRVIVDNEPVTIADIVRRLEALEGKAEPAPRFNVGDKVTLSAIVTGMNKRRYNIVVDGVPQPGGSLAVPPTALIAA